MSIPLAIKVGLREAQTMLDEGDFDGGIKRLNQLKQEAPEILMIQDLLGQAYMDNNNPGKAIKIFEKLVAVDPRNINFVGYLAQSYLLRGWHKKAVDTFKDAISFDEKNTFLWLGLSEAYMAGGKLWEAKEALQAALSGDQKEEDLAFTIYYKLLIIDITIFEPESMKENLKHVYELASAMPEEKDEIAKMLFAVARHVAQMQAFEVTQEILDKAWKLSPRNEIIKQFKNKIDRYQNIQDEYINLELDSDYEDDFIAFIISKIFPISDPHEDVYIGLIEYNFLNEFSSHKNNIRMLEEEYPKVYKELKGYFEQMQNKNKRYKKIKQGERFLQKNQVQLEKILLQQLLEMDLDDEDYDDSGDWDDEF